MFILLLLRNFLQELIRRINNESASFERNFLYTFVFIYVVVVQSLSCVQLFVTPWTAAYQASLSFTNSQSLLKLMSIELVMPSNHLILCHPLSSCLQSFPASGSFLMSRLFTSGGQSIIASASASVLPMNYSWLISLRMDWLDLLAVQGILKSLLQVLRWCDLGSGRSNDGWHIGSEATRLSLTLKATS